MVMTAQCVPMVQHGLALRVAQCAPAKRVSVPAVDPTPDARRRGGSICRRRPGGGLGSGVAKLASVGARIATSTLGGAAIGAISEVADARVHDREVTVKQVAKAAVIAGAVGGIGAGIGEALQGAAASMAGARFDKLPTAQKVLAVSEAVERPGPGAGAGVTVAETIQSAAEGLSGQVIRTTTSSKEDSR